jgi:Protein of unknown function (DUF805)
VRTAGRTCRPPTPHTQYRKRPAYQQAVLPQRTTPNQGGTWTAWTAWTAWTEATQSASSTLNPQAQHTIAGMSFPDAVKTVLTKYVNFTGRARRSEYWWYSLFIGIVYTVVFAGAIAIAVASAQSSPGATSGQTFTASGGSLTSSWP